MGIALVKKFGKRALWICHTFDLLQQSKDRAEMYMSTDLIGTITDGRVNIGKGITFATVQTLSALDLTRYKDIWDLCIVDECHHVCVSANSTTMFSKVLNNISARHKFGLSATVDRSDGLICATYALLGEIVYTVPKEAIKDRLVTVGIKPIGTGIEISRKCLNTDGTLNYIKLINYLIGNIDRNQIIINALLENIELSCLILSDRVDHLEYLKNYLSPYCKVAMIHGKMTSKKDKAERKQALEDMRSGEIRMLFASYSLAKEALDIPRLERVFFTTPVKGYTVVTQAIGRIERVFDDKTNPICYDFVDNIQYCVKAYKQRLQHYKKAGCYIVEGSCNGN
jgi:superfamily II DNA or RNA helicase